jgi:hypothetical protein
MTKGVTWGDLHNATFKELKKTYKLNDQQLEKAVRKHMDGANASDRRELYSKVWDKKDK